MQDDGIENNMSDSVKLGVMIHRMGALETNLSDIGHKLDTMGTLYPTMMHIDLLLAPFREKVMNLEENEKERQRDQTKNAAQLKLALIVALFSPLVSIFISLVLDNK